MRSPSRQGAELLLPAERAARSRHTGYQNRERALGSRFHKPGREPVRFCAGAAGETAPRPPRAAAVVLRRTAPPLVDRGPLGVPFASGRRCAGESTVTCLRSPSGAVLDVRI